MGTLLYFSISLSASLRSWIALWPSGVLSVKASRHTDRRSALTCRYHSDHTTHSIHGRRRRRRRRENKRRRRQRRRRIRGGEGEEEEEDYKLWPGNAIQADIECEAESGRQYLGRLAEAHNIDAPGHQALHNVVHSCVGVSTGKYGCERVHRPAVDHDLDESQQRARLPCAGWTLHKQCIDSFLWDRNWHRCLSESMQYQHTCTIAWCCAQPQWKPAGCKSVHKGPAQNVLRVSHYPPSLKLVMSVRCHASTHIWLVVSMKQAGRKSVLAGPCTQFFDSRPQQLGFLIFPKEKRKVSW